MSDPDDQQEFNLIIGPKLSNQVMQYKMSYGVQSKSENEMFIELADGGSPEAAYMVGSLFQHLSASNTVPRESTDEFGNLGVLELEATAFDYFEQAAEGGIGLGMQPLADMYFSGRGVKESKIKGCDWLWNACLISSANAQTKLDCRTLLPFELDSLFSCLCQLESQVPVGRNMISCCPNLSGLLANLAISGWSTFEGSLPPFAASTPTLTVGGPCRAGSTSRVLIPGSTQLLKVVTYAQYVKSTICVEVCITYGRRGTSNSFTTQMYQGTPREKHSVYYEIPPGPQCDETFSDEDAQVFYSLLYAEKVPVICVHCDLKSRQSKFA
jgi:hypothetical protein